VNPGVRSGQQRRVRRQGQRRRAMGPLEPDPVFRQSVQRRRQGLRVAVGSGPIGPRRVQRDEQNVLVAGSVRRQIALTRARVPDSWRRPIRQSSLLVFRVVGSNQQRAAHRNGAWGASNSHAVATLLKKLKNAPQKGLNDPRISACRDGGIAVGFRHSSGKSDSELTGYEVRSNGCGAGHAVKSSILADRTSDALPPSSFSDSVDPLRVVDLIGLPGGLWPCFI
jgi:hypothetical protein